MAGASNEELRWVGCLSVFGLVAALGFAGYRVWHGLSHAPPSVIAPPSARAQAALPSVEKPPAIVAQRPATEQVAPAPAARVSSQRARLTLSRLTVYGRLPPDVVRNIVRQDFGSLRSCNGEGVPDRRVEGLQLLRGGSAAVRFVVGRDGSVSNVSLESRAEPQPQACITQAILALRFPRPKEGIVTVQATVGWTLWPSDSPESVK